MRRSRRPAFLPLLALLAGCASQFGPSSIRAERPNYNREISASQDEQMLSNLVRLRYQDTPLFMELTSVVTSYTFDRSLGLGAKLHPADGDDEVSPSLGLLLGNRPTITYLPLQGEEFAQRMLSPMPLGSILFFAQTGWSVDRLLLLCVQRINDVHNAPTATGPTPAAPPDHERFLALAAQLQRLAENGLFGMNWEHVAGETMPPGQKPVFWLQSVRRTLALEPGREEFQLTQFPFHRAPDEIGMRGRSLLGLLYFLSQAVEAPDEHVDAGLVTVTRHADGTPFDWRTLLGSTMRIRSAPSRPASAYVAIYHRGHWFYVDDTDHASKASLNLLHFLFSLQSASGKGRSPVLTLPVGG
jgi:hypothetical protein